MKRILVVDDEPSIRRLLRVTLGNRGYEVLEAEDGFMAIAMAETEKPDLVVLDVMMPKLTGHQVHEKLRANPETGSMPILFLSAAGTFEEQQRELAADPNTDYMPKPFVPAEVADRVEAMLDPAKRAAFQRERAQREAKLHKIVEIMHRDRD